MNFVICSIVLALILGIMSRQLLTKDTYRVSVCVSGENSVHKFCIDLVAKKKTRNAGAEFHGYVTEYSGVKQGRYNVHTDCNKKKLYIQKSYFCNIFQEKFNIIC